MPVWILGIATSNSKFKGLSIRFCFQAFSKFSGPVSNCRGTTSECDMVFFLAVVWMYVGMLCRYNMGSRNRHPAAWISQAKLLQGSTMVNMAR